MNEGKVKSEFEKIMKLAKNPEPTRAALSLLFPNVARITRIEYSLESQRNKKNRRLYNSDYTSAYYMLSPQPATWEKDELAQLAEAGGPINFFSVILDRISNAPYAYQSRLLRLFLDEFPYVLERRLAVLSEWLPPAFLMSKFFIDFAERDKDIDLFSSHDRRFVLIIQRVLMKIETKKRNIALLSSLRHVDDISLFVSVIRGLIGDLQPGGTERASRKDLTHRDILYNKVLREKTLRTVKELAYSGRLWGQKSVSNILWFWWGCNDNNSLKDYMGELIISKKFLPELFNSVLSYVHSSSGNYYTFNESSWEKVFDINLLEDAAKNIIQSSGKEDHVLVSAAGGFIRALERYRDDPL